MNQRITTQPGFSLIELALVLLIIGIALGGVLQPLSQHRELDSKRRAEQQLVLAGEAVLGFALVNGRLPCPALLHGNGQENAQCNAEGELPWATLGILKEDPFGNGALRYRVTKSFADAVDGTGCGFAHPGVSFELCSLGDIEVIDSGHNLIAASLPFIIWSPGKQRTVLSAAESENLDEDTQFQLIPFARQGNQAFNDQLWWLPNSVLKSKMLAAGHWP